MQKHVVRASLLAALAIAAVVTFLGRSGPALEAQTPARPSSAATVQTPADDLQRSFRINTHTVAATSGDVRGETLYYYKCWVCHNKYTVAAGTPAPTLQDLYKRTLLPSGKPLNDESVAAQIRNGSPLMPAFGATLTDADMADLLTYLKGGRCCEEGEDPPPNPWYQAAARRWPVPSGLSSGARGVVRIAGDPGDSPEGIKVQLIAPNGVRTTVYTDEQGRYEFPAMQTGRYTLRIATPLEFKPYRRDDVRVDGASALSDIVLERVTPAPTGPGPIGIDPEALPATPEIEAQLSGAEILWNLSGTAHEKDVFRRGCGSGCHSYPQIFRNRYDERSWALIVDRMMHYVNATLINRQAAASARGGQQAEETIVKWLARVRGPGATDAPVHIFPRPRGASTRLVVTEFELPRQLLSAHDVSGDSKGNIWYTSHKSRFFGELDPRTGIVTEHAISITPGRMVGTHRVAVDQKRGDIVWVSEPWASKLAKFDPATKELKEIPLVARNFALAHDGSLWANDGGYVLKMDPETGKTLARYPMDGRTSYDNTVSDDGRFWAGGGPGSDVNYAQLLEIATGKMHFLSTGGRLPGPARGGFDPSGNAWFGGYNGALVEIDSKAIRMRDHVPPTGYAPYSDFYEAMPDKNGEVWAGVLHGRGMVRFDPRTKRWIEYVLPEPFGHDRRTWIDNSTTPVTVWYVDYQGYIVRLQPLE